MSFISLQRVSRVYGASPEPIIALRDIYMEVEKGEFIAIVGPSGSGKSTLLSIIGAMSKPTSGKVIFDGVALYQLSPDELADFRAKYLGFVFQQLYLMPYLTAIENVMLPLAISREPVPAREMALSSLKQVGLEDKLARLPGQLSTGEQARVAMARALVKSPPVILADEPTGNLDSRYGKDVVELLRQANQRGHTVILVTHDPGIASTAGRIIRLQDGKLADG